MGGGITSWTKVVPTLLKAGFGPLEVLKFLVALGAQLPSKAALLLLRKMLGPLDEMYGAAPFCGILTTKCEPKEVFDPVRTLFRITVRPTLKMAKEALNGLAFKAKIFDEALAFVSFFVEEIGGDKTLPEEFFFLCLERPVPLEHVINPDKLNVWAKEEIGVNSLAEKTVRAFRAIKEPSWQAREAFKDFSEGLRHRSRKVCKRSSKKQQPKATAA